MTSTRGTIYGNSLDTFGTTTNGYDNYTNNGIIGPGSFTSTNMVDFINRPSSISFMANTIN